MRSEIQNKNYSHMFTFNFKYPFDVRIKMINNVERVFN